MMTARLSTAYPPHVEPSAVGHIKEQIELCSPTGDPTTSSTSTPTSSPTTTGKAAKAKQSKSKGSKSASDVQITAFDSMKALNMETTTAPFIKRTRKHAPRESEIELEERK